MVTWPFTSTTENTEIRIKERKVGYQPLSICRATCCSRSDIQSILKNLNDTVTLFSVGSFYHCTFYLLKKKSLKKFYLWTLKHSGCDFSCKNIAILHRLLVYVTSISTTMQDTKNCPYFENNTLSQSLLPGCILGLWRFLTSANTT